MVAYVGVNALMMIIINVWIPLLVRTLGVWVSRAAASHRNPDYQP
jgi:hypothetical protein